MPNMSTVELRIPSRDEMLRIKIVAINETVVNNASGKSFENRRIAGFVGCVLIR
jgi:hypothetical protein